MVFLNEKLNTIHSRRTSLFRADLIGTSNTKSGKRREIIARLSFNTACELGFRSSLDEWEQLRGGERLQHAHCFLREYRLNAWSLKNFPAPNGAV
jgi:hypothetical protein